MRTFLLKPPKKIRTVLGVPSDSLLSGDREKNDAAALVELLERMPPESFRTVCGVIDNQQEAFSLGEKQNRE